MLIGGNWLTQNLALKKVRDKYKMSLSQKVRDRYKRVSYPMDGKSQVPDVLYSYKIYGNRYKIAFYIIWVTLHVQNAPAVL